MHPVVSAAQPFAPASATRSQVAATTRGSDRSFAEHLQHKGQTTSSTRVSAFELWWSSTPRMEGTLSDWRRKESNRFDRGGRTHYGITEATFMHCAGAAGLPKTREAFEAMTPSQARRIAASLWKLSGAERVENPGVAIVVGDWFWGSNSVAWRRIKLALADRGHAIPEEPGLGDKTIQILNQLNASEAIELLSNARRRHHDAIVQANPTQAVFYDGWTARTDERRLQGLRAADLWNGDAASSTAAYVPPNPSLENIPPAASERSPEAERRHEAAPVLTAEEADTVVPGGFELRRGRRSASRWTFGDEGVRG